MFSKILIANRGEIAVRIIRACRDLGSQAVVIYSDADRISLAVRMADEAYPIGPPPVSESYLGMDRIIEIARQSGAQAIHPGYGLLAENPRFAELVERNGLIFIGPSSSSIALMGDKLAARRLMQAAGVPIIPGSPEPFADEELAEKYAAGIGYPILLKAAAGGGGKGMRVVYKPEELKIALRSARSEASSAFGDDRVYIEKYLDQPRHIEVQIIADLYGNVVALGERECSIQRRHQKVIEESPSVVVDFKLRQKLCEVAVKAARACGYVSTGTVEFLVDTSHTFFFLEMNTRLQVEHPVTEQVTGIDLVCEQIAVAAKKKLSFRPEQIKMAGAAIECRIYAEDPSNNYFPSTGRLEKYREPAGPGVRVDSGVIEGDWLTPYYDPLLAKIITWGKDRGQAIERMQRALEEYEIFGVATNLPLLKTVLSHPRFSAGEFSTHFLDEEVDAFCLRANREAVDEVAAIASALHAYQQSPKFPTFSGNGLRPATGWKMNGRRSGLRQPQLFS